MAELILAGVGGFLVGVIGTIGTLIKLSFTINKS